MEGIYQQAIEKVANGSRFRVAFSDRSLKIDGKYVIKQGEYEGELGLDKVDNPLETIEQLFNRYYHSIPSERSENKRRKYFQALSEHELSDDDMLYGEQREVARIKLELYVLIMILNGSLVWDNFANGKWFWQSEKYPKLIIMKQWLIGRPTTS